MRVAVTNQGPTRSFPTCIGNIFIARGEMKTLDNEAAILEMTKFPWLKIERLPDEAGAPKPIAAGTAPAGPPAFTAKTEQPRRVDWAAMRIQDLRAIAARYHLGGGPKKRKVDLIKDLTAILG